MFQIRRAKKVDVGKPVKVFCFKLTCLGDLQNPDGSMNIDDIISHGQALQDAKAILGGDKGLILTDKNFLIPWNYPVATDYYRIEINIHEPSNLVGFKNLRTAMSNNIPLNADSRVTFPHFHDQRVCHIGYDPKAQHLFIF